MVLSSLSGFLRNHPRLYDFCKRLDPRRDPASDFFRGYSRRHAGAVTFVQVGANDGLSNDPIRQYVVRHGWRGLFVEPLPGAFEVLKRNYAHVDPRRLTFVNAAISEADAPSIPFWTLTDEFLASVPASARLSYLQKSSFSREHLLRTVSLPDPPEAFIRAIDVPCMTLNELLRRHWHGPAIQLLVIDAEGHEWAILSALDFSQWSPQTIFFESHNLGVHKSAVFDLLARQRYAVTELGRDSVAERTA